VLLFLLQQGIHIEKASSKGCGRGLTTRESERVGRLVAYFIIPSSCSSSPSKVFIQSDFCPTLHLRYYHRRRRTVICEAACFCSSSAALAKSAKFPMLPHILVPVPQPIGMCTAAVSMYVTVLLYYLPTIVTTRREDVPERQCQNDLVGCHGTSFSVVHPHHLAVRWSFSHKRLPRETRLERPSHKPV